MKINGVTDPVRAERQGAPRTEAKGPAPGGPATESVSLSELAGRLHLLESELSAGQPFDAARVQELKEAIREGRFRVNAGVVADRLIEAMKRLLAERR